MDKLEDYCYENDADLKEKGNEVELHFENGLTILIDTASPQMTFSPMQRLMCFEMIKSVSECYNEIGTFSPNLLE